jgi:hypothetical protein
VRAQLVQDLVHLEGRGQRLDEHRGLDRAAGDAEHVLREHEHVVPERASRCAPAWGGRSTAPCRGARARLRVVEEVQPEVEEAARNVAPVDAHVRLAQVPAPRPHEQHRGRSTRRYDLPVSGAVYAMVPRTASMRLTWPCTMLAHVGDDASSQSAMNTFAPELSALMIILRSSGPVISTRRSSRSAGSGATRQSPARTAAVSGRKSRRCPASRAACRATRAARSASTRP